MADPTGDDRSAGPLAREQELLIGHLRAARDALIWKVEGLDQEQQRRPVVPTGTNLLGMVKHMTWIEGWYLCEFFSRERPRLAWEWELDAEWGHASHMYATPEETTDGLVGDYRATSAAADQAIDELGLDAVGQHWSGKSVSLRSMVLVVLVDTARHAGHSDIMRELIDGRTGDRTAPSGFYGGADPEYRSTYLKRVRGEIDTPAWFDYLTTRGKRWG